MNQKEIKQALDFFKVLAHSFSEKILPALKMKELSVTEIYNSLNLEQSAVSVHLSKLREHKIVKARKDGKKTFYSINTEIMEKAEQACKLII